MLRALTLSPPFQSHGRVLLPIQNLCHAIVARTRGTVIYMQRRACPHELTAAVDIPFPAMLPSAALTPSNDSRLATVHRINVCELQLVLRSQASTRRRTTTLRPLTYGIFKKCTRANTIIH